MGKKKITTMRMDADLLKKAHDLGLNVSKVCENALKDAINRMDVSKTETDGGTRLDNKLARGVGFEPTRPFLTTDLAGLPPTRLGQPRKYPLTHFFQAFEARGTLNLASCHIITLRYIRFALGARAQEVGGAGSRLAR